VNVDALSPSRKRSVCPRKGVARYWDVVGHPEAAPAAWSYPHPLPPVRTIRGMVAFYNELVDITVDGIPQERGARASSGHANRPGN
jgi:uncharacterized protein (DUF427 family)